MKTAKLLLCALVTTASVGSPALAQDSATVTVQTHATFGAYLADADGRAVYLFEADTPGSGGMKAASACKDDCLAAWPPLTASGDLVAGEGASGDLLGSFEREDGAPQVTYNGWPLYYYHEDEAAGDVKGHDIEEFGAEWYLMAPSGEKAED